MDTPRTGGQPAEAFIPAIWGEHLVQLLRPNEFAEQWQKSPEGQAAMARRKQEAEKAAAERQRVLARHAELVAAETNPVLVKLLDEHAPQEDDGLLVCRKCPASEPDHWGDVEPAAAPCPTWSTIEAGA